MTAFILLHISFLELFEIGVNMAEGGTANADKETAFLSELIGNKSVTAIPGIEQAHAIKLRGKGVRKVTLNMCFTCELFDTNGIITVSY